MQRTFLYLEPDYILVLLTPANSTVRLSINHPPCLTEGGATDGLHTR
jgi:hypothetical protein